MIPARPDPTADRDPRDYHPNSAQVNQAEEFVLVSLLGAIIQCRLINPAGRVIARDREATVSRLRSPDEIALRTGFAACPLPTAAIDFQDGNSAQPFRNR